MPYEEEAVAEEQQGGLIVDDRVEKLRKILSEIIPKSKRKTIDYIVDMFTSNPAYQTPSGLYHLLTIFKLDPNQIKLVVEYVFGPGALDAYMGAPNPAPAPIPHNPAPPVYPAVTWTMTPWGPMPIYIPVPIVYQQPQRPVLVKRRRPVIGPDGKPVRDEKGNIVYEEVEEPVTSPAPSPIIMPPVQQSQTDPIQLMKVISEIVRSETETYRKRIESLERERVELIRQLEKERTQFLETLTKEQMKMMDMFNKMQLTMIKELSKLETEREKTRLEYEKELAKLRAEYEKKMMEMKAEYEKKRLEERIEGLKASFQHQLEDLKKELQYAERIRRLEEGLSASERLKSRVIDTLDDTLRGLRRDISELLALLRKSVEIDMKRRMLEAEAGVSTAIPTRVPEEVKEQVVQRIRARLEAARREAVRERAEAAGGREAERRQEEGKGKPRQEPEPEVNVVVVEGGRR